MRLASVTTLVGLVLAVCACGAEAPAERTGAPPGADRTAPTAPGGAPPDAAPPDPGLDDGPPPAWISTADGARWLAYATFCWGGGCADSGAPRCGDRHVPDVVVARGERVSFHLGFEPSTVSLRFFRQAPGTVPPEEIPLEAGRAVRWEVDRNGPVWLSATAGDGRDASYAACLRFAGGGS